ncbi:MAG: cytochrome c biogenesis CcdA family protein [Peptostreptococcaceae bacterium]|nr:cytochrome c biogenesis CcdA family protein [Peptostreptococcaceae bacterium]
MFGERLLVSSVFAAGFLSFFAPCTFPLIPVYIGFLTDEEGEYRKIRIGKWDLNIGAVFKTIAFVLGLSTSFVVLGFGAGFLGKWIASRQLLLAAGFLVVLLGIHQMDILKIPAFERFKGINIRSRGRKALGTYLMGISFSFGWTPCVGPILGAVLVTSASSGTEFYGAFLMLVYSAGLMLPFLLMAMASSLVLSRFGILNKHLTLMKRVGGVLVALMGVLLMSNQLTRLTVWFENLFV